ncbi:MAG TPA: ATP-binding cassette domain-containing protein [Rhodanobacteraceae bacterium]
MADTAAAVHTAEASIAPVAVLRDVEYRVGDAHILKHLNVAFRTHRFNVILGPNGAGKSSTLKIATGLVQPSSGEVTYAGRPLRGYRTSELARKRAVLSQHVELAFAMPVREVVMMGRYPHYGRAPSGRDRDIVARALDLVDMTAKRDQAYSTLSGGEQQKVQLARVLAQIWSADDGDGEKLLFLDEPTAGLDVHYQIHILDVARELLQQHCTVVAVLHDLNIALQYGNSFFMVSAGELVRETDDPADINQELIERIYGVRAHHIIDPETHEGIWRFSLGSGR